MKNKRNIRINRNLREDSCFICSHCGAPVNLMAPGTRQRNHCPYCLYSIHIDITPGDRRELCRGLMEPISLWVRQSGDTALLHRCKTCGALRSNRLAGDDDEETLRQIAMRALDAVRAGNL